MPRKPVEIRQIRGERLKDLIEDLWITQVELSKKISISQQTISKIINGKANLTEETARKITNVYPEYSFYYLMGFDVGKFSYNWISPNQRLPTSSERERVLAVMDGNYVTILTASECCFYASIEMLKWWMPVPELPKEST